MLTILVVACWFDNCNENSTRSSLVTAWLYAINYTCITSWLFLPTKVWNRESGHFIIRILSIYIEMLLKYSWGVTCFLKTRKTQHNVLMTKVTLLWVGIDQLSYIQHKLTPSRHIDGLIIILIFYQYSQYLQYHYRL